MHTSHVNFCHEGLHGIFFLKQVDNAFVYVSDPITYHDILINPVAGGFDKNYNSIVGVYEDLAKLGLKHTVLDVSYEPEIYVKIQERQERKNEKGRLKVLKNTDYSNKYQ